MRTKYVLSTVFALVIASAALSEPLALDVEPWLSDEALGELHDAIALANNSGATDAELDAAARVLAKQQHAMLPAYRDLYQATLDLIFERLRETALKNDLAAAYETYYRDKRWADTIDTQPESPMFSPEWTPADFYHPLMAKVDFPDVVVRQALWNHETETLAFALEPRTQETVATTFRITNIPTNFVARLEQEGRQIAAIDEHGQASGPRVVNLGPGEIELTVTLDGLTHFAIRPE